MSDDCVICDNELCVSWTDTHGIAQCVNCGNPYRIYHYEGEGENKRCVEKPPECIILPEYVPYLRKYWAVSHRIVPSGCSFTGGQELANRDDAMAIRAWMDLHGPKAKGES